MGIGNDDQVSKGIYNTTLGAHSVHCACIDNLNVFSKNYTLTL